MFFSFFNAGIKREAVHRYFLALAAFLIPPDASVRDVHKTSCCCDTRCTSIHVVWIDFDIGLSPPPRSCNKSCNPMSGPHCWWTWDTFPGMFETVLPCIAERLCGRWGERRKTTPWTSLSEDFGELKMFTGILFQNVTQDQRTTSFYPRKHVYDARDWLSPPLTQLS